MIKRKKKPDFLYTHTKLQNFFSLLVFCSRSKKFPIKDSGHDDERKKESQQKSLYDDRNSGEDENIKKSFSVGVYISLLY